MNECSQRIGSERVGGARRGGRCGAWIPLAGLLLVLAGCVIPVQQPEGDTLYHHNWWNYYERGVRFLSQNRTDDAMADFQRSLGLLAGAKFGNARDMWRARTYGLHFVEGYFPNRELGVCLLERNEVDQALQFLEKSLQQEPSGRAKHYLNLARQKQLSGRAVAAPQLQLAGDADAVLTRDRLLLLSGTASGEGLIRHLNVGGQAEFIELAAATTPFSRRVPLTAGTNRIEVVAADLLGQRTTRQVLCVADWQPPRFVVRRVTVQGSERLVEGVCRDESGVAAVLLGQASIFVGTGRAASLEVPVSLRVPLVGAALTVTDVAGNVLTCALTAAELTQTPRRYGAGQRPAYAAAPTRRGVLTGGWGLPSNVMALSALDAWSLSGRSYGVRRVALAETAQPTAMAPTESVDRLRPALSLRDCQPLTRVFAEDFFVDGTAADGGGLASVTLNGENLLVADDAGTARTYFARRLPLDLGTNQFAVVATDRSGNRTTRGLTVVRIRPEYLEPRYRLSVGVPPLSPPEVGRVSVQVKRSMEMELTREPVRFRLLERDEGWDFVLREQGLSVSDLADPSAALRIGKMVPAEMLLMGRIFTEAKGITVYLKVVETSNGEVVFSSDVYSPDSDRGLADAVAGLVLKVEQGFPLVTGEVLRRQGSRVTLSVGRQDGATEMSRFLVFSASGAESTGGQVCRAEGLPVQLQVEGVQENTSTARVIPSAADAIVEEGYHVYTR